MLKIMLF